MRADDNWKTCVKNQGAYFEGEGGIIVLCIILPVSHMFFTKCLYFSYCMAGYLLDRPCLLVTLFFLESSVSHFSARSMRKIIWRSPDTATTHVGSSICKAWLLYSDILRASNPESNRIVLDSGEKGEIMSLVSEPS